MPPPATLILAAVRTELDPTVRALGLRWQQNRAEGAFAGQPVIVAVTGVGDWRAVRCLHHILEDQPVARIIHVGFAGGLDPALRAGDIRRIGSVRNPGGQTVTLDEQHDTQLLTQDHLLATVEEKRAALERTGAAMVDMETFTLAVAAQQRGIPLTALRAVSDPADTVLPRAALQWVDPQGRASILRTITWLVRHPGECIALWRLARRTRRAANGLADEVQTLLKTG